MSKYKPFSQEVLEILQGDLYAVLNEHGPCTKAELKRYLRWVDSRMAVVLQSQPKWLVVTGVRRGQSKFGRLVLYHCHGEHILGFCLLCGRKNFHPSHKERGRCHRCASDKEVQAECVRTVPGVDLSQPTKAEPGKEQKIQILETRFDAGLPLHVEGDDYSQVRPGWEESQEEEPYEDE